MGIPYANGKTHKKKDHEWFLHCHDANREGTALRQSPEQVSQNRWLYTASSSVQPAIHFAWLTGCSELLLVGIGGKGYSKEFRKTKGRNTDSAYHMIYQDTKQVANVLYGKKWSHMYDIAPYCTDS
jgi:hypothetical protein